MGDRFPLDNLRSWAEGSGEAGTGVSGGDLRTAAFCAAAMEEVIGN